MEYIAHNANSWCSRSFAGDAELALLDRCIGYSPVPVLPFGDQFLPIVKSEVGNDDEYEIWNQPKIADDDLIKYEIVPEAGIIPSELIHFESEPVVVPPFTCTGEEKSKRKGRSKEKKTKEQSIRKPRPRRSVTIKEKSQRNPKQRTTGRNRGRKAKESSSTDSTSESVIFTRKKKMDETERQILERHLRWIDIEEEEPEPLPKDRGENSNLVLEPFNTASPISSITCESNVTEYLIL